ncbi:MAG: ABC transporter permease [Vicinamibacterales bacterium]
MALIPFFAMVRKDLLIFFSDRRSVIVSFVAPIAIASFFGAVFSGTGGDSQPTRIAVAIVDVDRSVISRGIVSGAQADEDLAVTTPDEVQARASVRVGEIPVAVVIPPGFGDAAGLAFLAGAEQPSLDLLFDPSKRMELAMVRGVLTQHVMQAVSREMFGGAEGQRLVEQALPQVQASTTMPEEERQRLTTLLTAVGQFNLQRNDSPAGEPPQGLTMPYVVREQAITSGENAEYNGYAHSFAGMAIQFLLFAMASLGVEMLLERQRGLWRRLRSAPVSKATLLSAKVASGALISLLILFVSFAFAMVVFGVRVNGSVGGFVLIAIGCALMASTFGLLVAALGNSPATARGITTLAVLMMVMLGGAWVPTFVFPAWLQEATRVVPVRWAVDGFDAMTWRGLGLNAALMPTLVLCGFAMLFAAIAFSRFRWEEG